MKALLTAAVFALANPMAFAQDKLQPLAAGGETIKVSAKVIAVDQPDRLIGLQLPNGDVVVVKAGDQVRNFGQIKEGDVVNAQYQTAAVISLKKGPGIRSSTEASSASRAKAGDKPAGAIMKEGSIVANVVAVNADKGTIDVKGPAGRVVHGKVTDKALLKEVRVGDQVEVDYVASLAMQVVPGAAKK